MTSAVRTRVLVVVVGLIVVLPLEALLLRAWTEPDPKLAIRSWVASLDADTLLDVASDIQSYPLLYRREIMRVLPPERRSQVWRAHIKAYLESHPGLDATAEVALEAAIALVSPSVFGSASEEDRRQMQAIGDQVRTLLGHEEADYLFQRLGPRDGRFASAEPLSMRFTNWMRGLAIALADDAGECQCNSTYGCDPPLTYCRSEGATCTLDDEWPACGWFWNQTCDGLCAVSSPQG